MGCERGPAPEPPWWAPPRARARRPWASGAALRPRHAGPRRRRRLPGTPLDARWTPRGGAGPEAQVAPARALLSGAPRAHARDLLRDPRARLRGMDLSSYPRGCGTTA